MTDRIILAAESATLTDNMKDVSGTAYSGALIKQEWSSVPLIIDLSGIQFSAQIPLLYNHTNSPMCRLGECSASVKDGKLTIDGSIDTGTELGAFIAEHGKTVKWQLSIGAVIVQSTLKESESSAEVNGQTVSGPVRIVTKSMLREVSVVAVGADPATELSIAAALHLNQEETTNDIATLTHGGQNMTESNTPIVPAEAEASAIEAARTAELTRIGDIVKLTADMPQLRERAISAGWTAEHVQSVIEASKELASHYGESKKNIIVKQDSDCDRATVEAAICLQAGVSEDLILKSCGQKAIETADRELRGLSLRGLVEECCRLDGVKTGRTFGNDTIRAAFSTVSLPGILSNVANKRALQAYRAQDSVAVKLCTKGSLSDFKESDRYRLNDVGDLAVVAPDGELQSGSLSEDSATNKLNTYGKVFTLTRQMIINDDLGEFLKIPTAMGTRAKRKIDQVFFERLLANPVQGDGNALFSAAHRNYKAGTDTVLSLDSLAGAVAMFENQVDADNQPIALNAKYLLVPTGLKVLAQGLTTSDLVIGGSTKTPMKNVLAGYGLEVISAPHLSMSNYTGHSDTGWYLFGNPAQIDTFEIGYLNGVETPTVEQGATDYNTLGMYFRVFFDFGIREQDFRGMTFFKGAN